MIIVRDIHLLPGESTDALPAKAAKKLRIKENMIDSWKIEKRSLDARKKNDIHYNVSITAELKGNEQEILARAGKINASIYEARPELTVPKVKKDLSEEERPVVVGFGPAGMFAALMLARAGARPIVIERGEKVEDRQKSVDVLRSKSILNTESNAQFGEGGAGTFSDGKLNTGTHDERISAVLKIFHEHGAKESVLYDAKPHIGTDVLTGIVKNIREEIISLGGEILFNTRFERFIMENGAIKGISVTDNSNGRNIKCCRVILAVGHSARDTFENLHAQNIPMERKAFSIGARIEHLQKDINLSQYGAAAEKLPAADYSLSVHLPDGNSAYTFCMCPGGHVFAAASEEGMVCTNGMSFSGRDGENANAALLVTVQPEDFPGEGVLAGMQWQRDIERKAFEYTKSCGPYFAASQLVGDFLAGKDSTAGAGIIPAYLPGVRWGSIREVLPEKVTAVMEKAIPELDKKLHGFANPEAVLTAPETRSSSPVRILRDKECRSAVTGLYPCGEGAGYAGGITSAAVDGLRCAQQLLSELV